MSITIFAPFITGSARIWRQASTIAQARDIIQQGVGTHFDPAVVEAFTTLPDAVLERIRLEIG